eukprot:4687859-Pyramimonas_sp.AAC.1
MRSTEHGTKRLLRPRRAWATSGLPEIDLIGGAPSRTPGAFPIIPRLLGGRSGRSGHPQNALR